MAHGPMEGWMEGHVSDGKDGGREGEGGTNREMVGGKVHTKGGMEGWRDGGMDEGHNGYVKD